MQKIFERGFVGNVIQDGWSLRICYADGAAAGVIESWTGFDTAFWLLLLFPLVAVTKIVPIQLDFSPLSLAMVAFAGAFRTHQRKHTVGPIRPLLDQPQRRRV